MTHGRRLDPDDERSTVALSASRSAGLRIEGGELCLCHPACGVRKGRCCAYGRKAGLLSNPVSSVNAFPRLTRAGVTGLRRYGTSRHHAVRDSGQQHSVMALEGGVMRIRPAVAAVIVGAAVMATPAVATAAYSGSNGRIVFEQGGFIYSIRQDGSDRRQLTTDTHSRGPSWSPDGGRVVFSRTTDGTPAGRSLYVAPAAGGAAHLLTARSDGCAVEPTWSATGRYVVYWDECASGVDSGGDAIRKVDTRMGRISDVVGVDGLAQPDGRIRFHGTGPDVTADGRSVVFTAATLSDSCGVAIADLSGGGFRFLSAPIDCGVFLSDDPAVSPDGKQVVYTAGNENPQLDLVRTNRSQQCCHPIYERGTSDFPTRPDWQPRPCAPSVLAGSTSTFRTDCGALPPPLARNRNDQITGPGPPSPSSPPASRMSRSWRGDRRRPARRNAQQVFDGRCLGAQAARGASF